MTQKHRFGSPLNEDVLEEYVFGRLPEAKAGEVEEHLFVCDQCRASLERVELEIRAFKAALLKGPAPVPQPKRPHWYLPAFRYAAAGALAAIVAIAAVNWGAGPSLPAAQVELSSYRGGLVKGSAHAPARHPLNLSIEAGEIASSGQCRLEVVNASGTQEWSGPAAIVDGRLRATLPKGLRRGRYWVRLYAPETELIREFGLEMD